MKDAITSLNPCFSGRYAGSRNGMRQNTLQKVLILVFREDMLGVHRRGGEARQVVLILVFREDMLGG